MMRILITEPDHYAVDALAIYSNLGELSLGPLSREALVEKVPDFDVVVLRLAHHLDAGVLERANRLKAIVSPTTGLDHIDVGVATRKGIAVLSLKGETDFLRSIPATAELTWGLLLALVRHIPQAHTSVLEGEWDRDRFRGNDLSDRRLGILGLGRIGEKIARYAQAFGMQVAAYDPYVSEWQAGVERCETLSSLLAQSDVLSIHVPLNDETTGMVGARELEALPRGALVVNTSRGDVLDETALLAALNSGQVGGAALDVIANERAGGGRALAAYARQHDNLILTPHIGGATVESMAATEIFMASKLENYLKQKLAGSGERDV